MGRTIKLDPTKIEFDGKGFKAVIPDRVAFNERLKLLRKAFMKKVKNQ